MYNILFSTHKIDKFTNQPTLTSIKNYKFSFYLLAIICISIGFYFGSKSELRTSDWRKRDPKFEAAFETLPKRRAVLERWSVLRFALLGHVLLLNQTCKMHFTNHTKLLSSRNLGAAFGIRAHQDVAGSLPTAILSVGFSK